MIVRSMRNKGEALRSTLTADIKNVDSSLQAPVTYPPFCCTNKLC